jgi:hypothetical protein
LLVFKTAEEDRVRIQDPADFSATAGEVLAQYLDKGLGAIEADMSAVASRDRAGLAISVGRP